MSLIADALKRAQEQRAQGRPGKDDDDRARRMLSGSRPLRIQRDADRGVPRSALIAGAVLVAALAVFAGVVWLAPSVDEGTAVATNAASPDAPGASPATRGDAGDGSGAGGRADTGADVGAEPGLPATTTGGDVARATSGSGAEPPPGAEAAVGDPGSRTGPAAGDAGSATGAQGGQASADGASQAAAGQAGAGVSGAIVEPAAVPEREAAPSFTLRLQGREAVAPLEASELFGRALGAQQAGDLGTAASLYRRAIAQNPSDAQLHNNLGTVYRRLSMPGEALAAFREAVAVDPSYAPAWSNLGLMLDGMGRDDEAIDAFRTALRHDPSNTGARVNLANKYLGAGLVDDAVSILEGVLRDAPALPEAHYAMARARETAGETAPAIRHYRVFLELAAGRFPALEDRVAGHLAELEGGGE